MANDWSQLDHAEGSTHRCKATVGATTAPTPPSPAGHVPEGDSHNAGGIAKALARRSAVNEASPNKPRQARKMEMPPAQAKTPPSLLSEV